MMAAFLADIQRHSGSDRELSAAARFRLLAHYPGLQALLGYRLGRALLKRRRRLYYWPLLPFGWVLYYLISRYIWLAFDIRLKLSAEIAPALYIGHFGNILVQHCRIGRHCSIAQSVHIRPLAGRDGPEIGDYVWIGAHAKIVGAHRIGSGSTIGAGAVVEKDVPAQALCMGAPARVVVRNYDNRSILGIRDKAQTA